MFAKACLLLTTSLLAISIGAQCVVQSKPANAAGSINVCVGSGWGATGSIQGAIQMWDGCTQAGTGFPSLVMNGFGDIPITINHISGSSGNSACGETVSTPNAAGQIVSAVTTIFDSSTMISDCSA